MQWHHVSRVGDSTSIDYRYIDSSLRVDDSYPIQLENLIYYPCYENVRFTDVKLCMGNASCSGSQSLHR